MDSVHIYIRCTQKAASGAQYVGQVMHVDGASEPNWSKESNLIEHSWMGLKAMSPTVSFFNLEP